MATRLLRLVSVRRFGTGNRRGLGSQCQQLAAAVPGTNATDAVETIRRAIRGQSRIIDDLLDLSRIRTGKLKLNITPVDVCAVVDSIVEVARADASTEALEIHWECDEQPVIAQAHISRLEQIVWNLLGNAIKFTPAGGSVRLSATVEARFCRLTVSDTGQGIDPAFLPRMFELFNQAPGRALTGKAGLGIGLAVVREIVVLHGGRIEVASDGPGLGSRFDVWLPRVMPERRPRRKPATPGHDQVWNGLRLLIVDDTREAVDGLARLLELEEATVWRAYSGAEALEVLGRQEVDLVLSDLGMPEMDGYELARRIKGELQRPDLPIVAVTGFARSDDARRSEAAGLAAHIGKPIMLESLGEVVESVLRRGATL